MDSENLSNMLMVVFAAFAVAIVVICITFYSIVDEVTDLAQSSCGVEVSQTQ